MLTDEQKKIRKTGIGGSEIAAVVGLNPYASPIDVWRSKVEGHELEETGPMKRGRFLEDGVARWWAHDHGAELREVGTIRHPREEIVMCTPDRLASFGQVDPTLDLSIKVPGPHVMEQWGPDGSDEVPDAYLLQAQWELIPLGILYGIRKAVIAAPIRGDLHSYPVDADEDIQGQLIEAAKRFWGDHILTGRPPPADSSASYGEWLKVKYQNGSEPEVRPTPELASIVEELRQLKANAKEMAGRERGLRNQLLTAIGDAAGVEGLCSYRITKGRPATDWQAICREAGVSPAVVEKHTSRTPYRVLRLSRNGDDNE